MRTIATLATVLLSLATAAQTPDFRKAEPGYAFAFPFDHGSHPAYAIEWWYITGHLFEENGRRYGFQATFFRRGIKPKADDQRLFGDNQIYMAHMAILDVEKGVFLSQDRINRDGWDAGAAIGKLAVHNGNWSLHMIDAGTEVMDLRGSVRGRYGFELTLEPAKPRVIFGENGVSQKAKDAASLYITFPRLAVTGTLTTPSGEKTVTGTAWMDHEISTSQLSEEQVGWDWASIQLDDGQEIMLYLLREKDGGYSSFSKLTWIFPDSRMKRYAVDTFTWRSRDSWTSSATGITYPVDFDLSLAHPVSGDPIQLRLKPLIPAQEFEGTVTDIHYWEGACEVLDASGKVIGSAFIELTGYGGSIQGKF